MNAFKLTFRTLFKKGRSNTIKVFSLATGLAVGLTLISKVLFELSYDNFYPQAESIYRVDSKVAWNNNPPESWGQVSGAIAPGLKESTPRVELATRYTFLGDPEGTTYTTADKRRLSAKFILADSCFYRLLPRRVIAGDAHKALTLPMNAIVSESLAKKMGGDALGKSIWLDSYPGKEIVISAIFEDMPQNSTIEYDIAVSLVSIGNFMWDGTNNWLGNDRYKAFVKLTEGTHPDDLAEVVREMQIKNQDMEAIKKAGVDLSYGFTKLTDIHSRSSETKKMNLLLSVLAASLIGAALFNYILIVVSTLASRAKEIAIYKCYGAREREITLLVLTETAVHLVISLVLALLLLLVFRSTAEEILSVSLSSLVTLKTGIAIIIVSAIVLTVSVALPARLFSNIPVATVINNFRISGKRWKQLFLWAQFFASSLLIIMLVITVKQYNLMINHNPGYNYNNLLYFTSASLTAEKSEVIKEGLEGVSYVDMVAGCSTLPFDGQSGNNVYAPGDNRELFNIADMYYVDHNYLSALEVPIVEGSAFRRGKNTSRDVMVSRSFATKMSEMVGWADGVVGKSVMITEHGMCVIVGVYEDFRIGSIIYEDTRPSAMFYKESPGEYLVIKLKSMNPESIAAVNMLVESFMPEKNFVIVPFRESIVKMYNKARVFRNSLLIGGIITLLITLSGLIGYLKNEVHRRGMEISIRKISGATVKQILMLLSLDILILAVPATIVAIVISIPASGKILENFSEKAQLTFAMFASCALFVIALILLVVVINSIRIANRNPVSSFRSE